MKLHWKGIQRHVPLVDVIGVRVRFGFGLGSDLSLRLESPMMAGVFQEVRACAPYTSVPCICDHACPRTYDAWGGGLRLCAPSVPCICYHACPRTYDAHSCIINTLTCIRDTPRYVPHSYTTIRTLACMFATLAAIPYQSYPVMNRRR